MQRVYLERSKCLALAPNMNSYVEPWRFILLHNKCMHMTYRDKTEFTYGCSSVFLFSFASFRFSFVFSVRLAHVRHHHTTVAGWAKAHISKK